MYVCMYVCKSIFAIVFSRDVQISTVLVGKMYDSVITSLDNLRIVIAYRALIGPWDTELFKVRPIIRTNNKNELYELVSCVLK